MNDQKIMVTSALLPPMNEYIDEIKGIWDSHLMTNFGALYERLRTELINYLDVPDMTLFTNGHLALEGALAAFDLHGEVITTPFTFLSTTLAIARSGLTPVFCDVDPDSYCMDPAQIEGLITPRTSAIMPVHVYGRICETEKIEAIAKKHGLRVIYDGAHAFGVKKNGMGIGVFGDATMYSFHATKVFNTIEGGAVAFHDESLSMKLRQLQNFGLKNAEEADVVGGNAKMNEFQAAMGLCNLRHVAEAISARKLIADRYGERLGAVAGITMPKVQEGIQTNYAYYPVFFDESSFGEGRDAVAGRLERNGIIARKYFYPLTSKFECIHQRFDCGRTPVAERAAASVLTLPIYPGLSLKDVDRICNVILERHPRG